ncbi:M42 family metallopeptidase [Mycoplasmatota bacterium]|nr:M42 family metallopeptidase [Mycoplasmatota bacterium]
MEFNKTYFLNLAKELLTTPSPSGYCHNIMTKIEHYANELNLHLEKTNKGNAIITFEGENKDYTVGLSAHVDTLGLMVRSVNQNGTLKITTIGGNQPNSLIGEYCTIFNRDNKTFSGTILTTSYSSHVYDNANKLGSKFDDLMIRIDEMVKNKQDVLDLGICNGDFIAIDPKTTITENDFIKSRHIDDKISVAIIFTLFKAFIDEKIKPKNTIKFIISTYEEVGHGSSHIPCQIEELIAVDMGCIGKDLACTEYDVSICAKDSSGPYDYFMTSRLIDIAKSENLSHAVDIYPFYGSDASAALRGGNNIKAALIGPGVHASHGMERTHYNACLASMKLLAHYLTK